MRRLYVTTLSYDITASTVRRSARRPSSSSFDWRSPAAPPSSRMRTRSSPASSASAAATSSSVTSLPYGVMTDRLTLDVDGAFATLTTRHPDQHNDFEDEMHATLWAPLTERK